MENLTWTNKSTIVKIENPFDLSDSEVIYRPMETKSPEIKRKNRSNDIPHKKRICKVEDVKPKIEELSIFLDSTIIVERNIEAISSDKEILNRVEEMSNSDIDMMNRSEENTERAEEPIQTTDTPIENGCEQAINEQTVPTVANHRQKPNKKRPIYRKEEISYFFPAPKKRTNNDIATINSSEENVKKGREQIQTTNTPIDTGDEQATNEQAVLTVDRSSNQNKRKPIYRKEEISYFYPAPKKSKISNERQLECIENTAAHYLCDTCNKTFKNLRILLKHQRLHTMIEFRSISENFLNWQNKRSRNGQSSGNIDIPSIREERRHSK